MSKPRILDLFSGAGGAAVGYHRAGFDVVGVDIVDQPNYPFTFYEMDALEFVRSEFLSRGAARGWGFKAIHASPPCQRFSDLAKRNGNAEDWPDLIEPTRSALRATGLPYVIENVEGAPLLDPGDPVRHAVSGTAGDPPQAVRDGVPSITVAALRPGPAGVHLRQAQGPLRQARSRRLVCAGHGRWQRHRGEQAGGHGDLLDDRQRAQRGHPARVHRAHRGASARASRSAGGGVSSSHINSMRIWSAEQSPEGVVARKTLEDLNRAEEESIWLQAIVEYQNELITLGGIPQLSRPSVDVDPRAGAS
jgi:hypothetical protein